MTISLVAKPLDGLRSCLATGQAIQRTPVGENILNTLATAFALNSGTLAVAGSPFYIGDVSSICFFFNITIGTSTAALFIPEFSDDIQSEWHRFSGSDVGAAGGSGASSVTVLVKPAIFALAAATGLQAVPIVNPGARWMRLQAAGSAAGTGTMNIKYLRGWGNGGLAGYSI